MVKTTKCFFAVRVYSVNCLTSVYRALGADFEIIPLPATIDFSPDVQMIPIPVNISEDGILEPLEVLRLILARPMNSPNYNFGLTATTMFILDNDSKHQYSILDWYSALWRSIVDKMMLKQRQLL